MWCEMIVPWMGHTKMYFPFAASEFRAADAPLSRQVPQMHRYHAKHRRCAAITPSYAKWVSNAG
ncbi:MAG: hypothetical protein IJO90_04210 [Alistipes sp.]|nr:hypothetical protein [Alistipes sp.]